MPCDVLKTDARPETQINQEEVESLASAQNLTVMRTLMRQRATQISLERHVTCIFRCIRYITNKLRLGIVHSCLIRNHRTEK